MLNRPEPSPKKHRPLSFSLAFAGIASLLEHAGIHWLDTWLRRIQNSKQPITNWEQRKKVGFDKAYQRGIIPVVRSLHNGFWISALYKVFARMIVFGGQQPAANVLHQQLQPTTPQGVVLVNAVAGGTVSAMQVVLTPLDAIKIKKQNGDSRSIKNMLQEDKTKLFKGALPTMLRNVPGAFTQFAVWKAASIYLDDQMPSENTYFARHCTASILGALAAVLVTNPQDVIKTMIQTHNSEMSNVDVMKEAYRTLGIHGLFTRGLGMRSLGSGPKFALPLIVTGLMWQEYDKIVETNHADVNIIEETLRR
ncbi:MAG: MC/SLC25 family protein [Gammaproteobacteria bacterium]